MRTFALFADLPDGKTVCLETPTDDYAGVKGRYRALKAAGGKEGDVQYLRVELWNSSAGECGSAKFAAVPDPSQAKPDKDGLRKPRVKAQAKAEAPAPAKPDLAALEAAVDGLQSEAVVKAELSVAAKAVADEAEKQAKAGAEDPALSRQARAALTKKAQAAREAQAKAEAAETEVQAKLEAATRQLHEALEAAA